MKGCFEISNEQRVSAWYAGGSGGTGLLPLTAIIITVTAVGLLMAVCQLQQKSREGSPDWETSIWCSLVLTGGIPPAAFLHLNAS